MTYLSEDREPKAGQYPKGASILLCAQLLPYPWDFLWVELTPGASLSLRSWCRVGLEPHVLSFHQLLLFARSRAPHVGILYLNQEKQSC